MSKLTIDKIIPAKTLIKRRSQMAKSKKIFLGLLTIFIIPILLFANHLMTKTALNKPKEESLATTSFQQNLPARQPSSFSIESIPTPPVPFPDTSQVTNEFGDTIIADTDNYRIVYYGKSGLFVIAVYSLPTDKFKSLAEEAFLSKLGLDQKQACELNVEVKMPVLPNEQKTGLSFCR